MASLCIAAQGPQNISYQSGKIKMIASRQRSDYVLFARTSIEDTPPGTETAAVKLNFEHSLLPKKGFKKSSDSFGCLIVLKLVFKLK